MLKRIVILLAASLAHSHLYSADLSQDAVYITDGTANLALVASVSDARTRKPLSDATVTAIRAGRGTTLLASDSKAMPPPQKTDGRGRAVLHADFRYAGDATGDSIFVGQSFLRVQALG